VTLHLRGIEQCGYSRKSKLKGLKKMKNTVQLEASNGNRETLSIINKDEKNSRESNKSLV